MDDILYAHHAQIGELIDYYRKIGYDLCPMECLDKFDYFQLLPLNMLESNRYFL